jgi:hypothetical protein
MARGKVLALEDNMKYPITFLAKGFGHDEVESLGINKDNINSDHCGYVPQEVVQWEHWHSMLSQIFSAY